MIPTAEPPRADAARPRLGVIAGKGQLPFLLARAARAAGREVVAAGFVGQTDPALAGEVAEYRELKLGKLGGLIKFFLTRGAREVVMGGAIDKPRGMAEASLDFRALSVLPRLLKRGDDAILRAVREELEKDGLRVVAVHEVLPGLLTPEGVLTARRPDADHWADLAYGFELAKSLGTLDVGQTLVVSRRSVVAVEAMEGTDACLRRGGGLVPGATVVKVCKPMQDRRIDLPSVGLETIHVMRESGLRALGVEAGASLFFDREAAVRLADEAGIVIVGLTPAVLAGRI